MALTAYPTACSVLPLLICAAFKVKQPGRHCAVEWEAGAIAGGRTQRILIGNGIGACHNLQVIDQCFGVCTEPQSETARHGNLQVGVARHEHVFISLAELLQPLEELISLRSQFFQLGAVE